MQEPTPLHQPLPDHQRYYNAQPATSWERFRRRLGGRVVKAFLTGLSRLGSWHPAANPNRHGVEVLRNIPYGSSQQEHHLLDVYRPKQRDGLLPALLYIHGGGFRILSKDTHWVMGLGFARSNYVTFNINYRLTPEYPFPAGAEDCATALLWLLEHAEEYGADPHRIILAGESAGANFATMLTLTACYDRFHKPWAQEIFQANPKIVATLPGCGLLQVTRPDRFFVGRKLHILVQDRIVDIATNYLPEHFNQPGEVPLADPLLFLEEGHAPDRPLPPFFVLCGTKDPIVHDTERMQTALMNLEVECETRFYPKQGHAFHAMLWKKAARQCWKHQLDFLQRHVPPKAI